MGERIRAFDWASAPIGPVRNWPAALASTLSIVVAARFPMAIYWGEAGWLFYNDAWRPILGEKHPWALGRPAHEVWPEIWEAIAPRFAAVRRTGEATWDADSLLPMQRFGYTEECYFDYTFNPVRGADGKVDGILNVVQETTDRVLSGRRTELLRELSARTAAAKTEAETCERAVSAFATDPADFPFTLLYLVDLPGRKARLIAADGVSTDSPSHASEVSLDADNAAWPLGEALRTGGTVTVEDIGRRFGTAFRSPWPEPVTQGLILPIAGAAKEGYSAVLVVGVNPRRSMDNDYRRLLELTGSHLATAIATAHSYASERRRAEQLAELDRAKTTFFSNVSHEFRTPLTLILGPLEELRARAAASPALVDRAEIDVVHRNSLRLLKLVNTLLDFSRIEAGRAQAAFVETNLARLTAELASVFHSAMAKAKLAFAIDCQPLPKPVFVDADLWEKIVFNLLSNALKYTLSGEVRLAIRAETEHAVLSVRDTGLGIAPEELPNLFRRFHRIENVRGRTHEGTGIGLALVHELVKLHGGTIEVESELGRGTEFRIRVPFGEKHLPPEHIGSTSVALPASSRADSFVGEALSWFPEIADHAGRSTEGKNPSASTDNGRYAAPKNPQSAPRDPKSLRPRILLAEDNADMRDYVRRLLSEHYAVEAVANGAAALEATRRDRPDLLLSDVMMPGMNGIELVQRLRADEALRTLPVILLSARAGEEARVEGATQGADDYLTKPFSARELLARVALHLELARVRESNHRALHASEARLASEAQALLNLNTVSSILWQSRDLSGGLQEMLQATIDMLGADMGNVQVMNPKGVLIIAAQRGFQTEFLDCFREVAADKDCACGRALRSGERLVIEDVECDAPYAPFRAIAKAAGYRAVQSTPLLSRSGAPLGMISTHWRVPHAPSGLELRRLDLYARQAADFIERYRNDEALRQTKERFDIVKNSTQVGFWFCDLPFDKLAWDDRVKEHFWLPPETEVTIDIFYERLHPEDREKTRQAIEISIATKSHYEIEYRTVSPDTQVKWIRAIGRGFYDGVGEPVRFDGVTLDITDRKRAEALLRNSEAQLREGRERLQAALNGSGAGTFRWNIQTNALEWDENLDRLFGLPPGKTIRSLENFIAVVHPDERLGVIERCDRCAREGADFDMEFRIIWPDGSIHWLDDQGATVRDATGQSLYMTGMCLDITERKLAEEALRTAKERAEAASRSKDDFLAALSHELRTPLTPVLMTAAALKDDPSLSPDIRAQLGMMERNIALEARLIDDLLDLTAISHGKLKMRLERCDLNTLIERAMGMVAQDAGAKDLAISCNSSASQPVLIADVTRLQQVIWNLLRNAVKFTPPGGKISIWTHETLSPDGKPWLTLEITDTGIGIEAAHIAQIFKPFDQGSHSGNHRFGGLGLGLAIARAVVIAHGGRIQAQSEGVGRGATFVVDLPHAPAASPLAKQATLSPPTPPGKITPLRLLLVEDHASTLQTLAMLLKRDGHRVTTSSTIASAKTAAAQDTFDLVISDLGLPDGSGTQLMDGLRASYGLCGIALSGYGMQEDLARSKEAGFVAHLVKPVAISDLRRTLEDFSRT